VNDNISIDISTVYRFIDRHFGLPGSIDAQAAMDRITGDPRISQKTPSDSPQCDQPRVIHWQRHIGSSPVCEMDFAVGSGNFLSVRPKEVNCPECLKKLRRLGFGHYLDPLPSDRQDGPIYLIDPKILTKEAADERVEAFQRSGLMSCRPVPPFISFSIGWDAAKKSADPKTGQTETIRTRASLGLRPRCLWLEARIDEILNAVARTRAANECEPVEWLDELAEIRREIDEGQKAAMTKSTGEALSQEKP
jgi:hypothetical protein